MAPHDPEPSAPSPGPTQADSGLWTRAVAGEAPARAELAELAQSVARAELVRRGAPPAELADLVQEIQRTTFAFLARNPLPPRDLWTFLKYRTWGVLSDHRKKMRASPLDFRSDLEPELTRRPQDPRTGEGLRAREIAAVLADCRRKLPGELSRVLAMRYDAGLATDGIQRELGVHRNTVHVRVFRALERLRECMHARGYGAEDLQ